MHLSRRAVINFINGLFEVDHPLNSTVAYPNTETVSGGLKRLMSDMIIVIGGTHVYHIEAQISEDAEMVVRMFRYGFEESLRTKELSTAGLTLRFPNARVIYWEGSRKTPDKLALNLVFPDGKTHRYAVPTVKFLDLSIAEIERRKLVILLPFYVLKLRKQMKAAKSEGRRLELAGEMDKILAELDETAKRGMKKGLLETNDLINVVNHIKHLQNELYEGYTAFKEINEMPVRIVDYAEELKKKARREGIRETSREIARKMKEAGRPSGEIATFTGLSPKAIEKL
jgi:hypothetical protein